MRRLMKLLLLLITGAHIALSSPARPQQRMLPSSNQNATLPPLEISQGLQKRQITTIVSTCGYLNGNIKSSRTADSGFGCRVDTSSGLWGFCPTTVIKATDCGLAGYCVDAHSCQDGCGRLSSRKEITTITCEEEAFCSTALLINGPDQSFEYIACGQTNTVQSYLAVPNAVEAATTPDSTFPSTSAILRATSDTEISYTSTTNVSTTPDPRSTTTTNQITIPSVFSSNSAAVAGESSVRNTGAIVGGTIAGLVVICCTILGLFMMRLKRKASPLIPNSAYIYDEYTGPVNSGVDVITNTHEKMSFWDSSHGPVELRVQGEDSSPVELPVNNTLTSAKLQLR